MKKPDNVFLIIRIFSGKPCRMYSGPALKRIYNQSGVIAKGQHLWPHSAVEQRFFHAVIEKGSSSDNIRQMMTICRIRGYNHATRFQAFQAFPLSPVTAAVMCRSEDITLFQQHTLPVKMCPIFHLGISGKYYPEFFPG
ncbi:MAG: hypothetical protein C5S38_06940 [Candidatus Methanophagaceae archaeon]|nr:MAG: hypothetical protein C5S38_06940 [Methanophagales archaeon]